jgi:hypothetical protein
MVLAIGRARVPLIAPIRGQAESRAAGRDINTAGLTFPSHYRDAEKLEGAIPQPTPDSPGRYRNGETLESRLECRIAPASAVPEAGARGIANPKRHPVVARLEYLEVRADIESVELAIGVHIYGVGAERQKTGHHGFDDYPGIGD